MPPSSPPPTKAKPKAPSASADPLAQLNPKSLALRVGLPLLIVWIVAIAIGHVWSFAVAGLITALAVGLLGWALRFAQKSRNVAALLKGADTPEARKEALAKLESEYKKGDSAAVFAKAQLLLQEDPRKALETLETIDLNKVMAPIADEARAQRAMIHLVLGEPDRARVLVDAIELGRHQVPKTRAMIASIIAEAWSRTGQAKKALDTLAVFDFEDPEFTELKPQLYRALVFAQAATNDAKGIRRSLRKMLEINPQLLAGFLGKKVHPLLQKEARDLVARSGAIPRKVAYKRM